MTAAADLVCRNAEVHTLADPDETHEALAVRDGRLVRLGSDYEVGFLVGVDTRVLDLEGRVVLPGFVDAHTHLRRVGRRRARADLGGVGSVAACLDRLREEAARSEGWVLGFGFDESEWNGGALTREELDAVGDGRPVAAFREDMHTVVVNTPALNALGDLPAGDVRTDADGAPTGVLVESAVAAVERRVEPSREETRDALLAAQALAHRRGVTGVHDVVDPTTAAAYRDLDAADELRLRVRLLWRAGLDALRDAGVRPNHGSAFVRQGALKAFSDGSIGSHTARLAAPYADGGGRGQWVVDPDALAALAARAAHDGWQVAVHAIGDEAVGAALNAYEAAGFAPDARPRIEHAELATDDHLARMADLGVVASMQPNFHRWAGAGGLYETRLGAARRDRTNRLAAAREAGVPLAFGSDCMPLDPLFGVHHAANAPTPAQSLPVTAALRAYTGGSARAGFDESRVGRLDAGMAADFVALDGSPWDRSDEIRSLDAALTVVDGDVVHAALPGVDAQS